ncbi:MAG TPA: hypothetical protein VMZ25_10765, partial [Terriglobales bacterium]|nr:hypothetical protein [Terriglobales bacterium]
MNMRCFRWLILLVPVLISAQDNPPAPKSVEVPAIEDNSFLIEEAYNQEHGVVQHIQSFTRTWNSQDWVYSFTQEWPFNPAP